MASVEQRVLDDTVGLIEGLAGDWEYTGGVSADTFLLADLGMQSLDLVVLGTQLQERYGRLPFAEFLAEIGRRPVQERDVTVGDMVNFVCQHRSGPSLVRPS